MTGIPPRTRPGRLRRGAEQRRWTRWPRSPTACSSRVDGLTAEAVGGPSLLPGWTRGHVLTHLARNADALANLVLAARTGDGRPMYPGGPDGREAAIEAGAGRHLGDLRLDLDDSAERLLEPRSPTFPAEAQAREVAMRRGATAYGWEIPLIRIREVEIHHVDLDAGYTPDDWDPDFAARTLDQLAPFFRDARDCPVGVLVATDADARWEVAAGGPGARRPGHRAGRVAGGPLPGRRAWRCSPPARYRRRRGGSEVTSRADAAAARHRRSPSRRCPNPL